ncbi:MAG: Mth938-like domain-containing protein [Alphaproteobacteria bacterium]
METSDFIQAVPDDPRQINAYDDNGFRLKEKRYEGAILIFGDTIMPWQYIQSVKDITPESFDIFLKAKEKPELILVGTGANFIVPPFEIRKALRNHHIALEWMNTKAALSTWPILLGDGRHVAGCLLPISFM